jgi:hypothetical protein
MESGESIMESMPNASRPVPKWVQKIVGLAWYEWLAWIVEISLIGAFVLITYDQFEEGLQRGGWLMILITILFCGPGMWLLLRYKPESQSLFGKFDIGAIVCFAIWAILLGYFLIWTVDFQPGFGNRV